MKSEKKSCNGIAESCNAGSSLRFEVRELDNESKAPRRKWVMTAEKICVGVFMVWVWMLLLLPIIFYHIPVDVKLVSSEANSTNTSITNEETCDSAFPYPVQAGDVCRNALRGILSTKDNCDSDRTPMVLRDGDSDAKRIQFGLRVLGSREDCVAAVVPFLCLFLFGLCDSSGVSLQPTSGQCQNVRDNLCASEWLQAQPLLARPLPVCEDLPDEQASCPVQSGSGSGITTDSITSVPQNTSELLPCREAFFQEEKGGPCIPSCEKWHTYSPSEVAGTDAVILLSAVIGVASGLVVIIISIVRFKRMLVFPSAFVVYLSIDLLVIEFFVMVTYFDRSSLYCTSPNLIKSIYNSTPFCVISGMAFVYAILQTAIWWLFHTTALFWKIQYPFHARSFQMGGKIKYIHISCIIAGLLIPLLPVITTMADFAVDLKSNDRLQKMNVTFFSGGLGYRLVRFPPLLCSGRNSEAVYYTSILPINIIVIAGLTELIILFWTIHKRYRLFRAKKSNNPFKLGTPERKILVTLCYYVLMTVFALSRFTLIVRNAEQLEKQLTLYFTCEGPGHNSSDPCDRNDVRQLTYPIMSAISLTLIGLFPVVNLVYALNIQELREKICGLRSTTKRGLTSESTSKTNL